MTPSGQASIKMNWLLPGELNKERAAYVESFLKIEPEWLDKCSCNVKLIDLLRNNRDRMLSLDWRDKETWEFLRGLVLEVVDNMEGERVDCKMISIATWLVTICWFCWTVDPWPLTKWVIINGTGLEMVVAILNPNILLEE